MENMFDKIQALYKEYDRLKASGDDVVADLKKEINNLELSYLKECVLPEVAKFMAAKIKGLRCGIDCSLQYNSESTLDYSFCTSGLMVFVKDRVDIDNVVEYHEKDVNIPSSKKSIDKKKSPVSSSVPPIKVWIEKYSQRTIAIYGDTDAFSELFKDMGGYFCTYLKSGKGWIFLKDKESQLRELLAGYISEVELKSTDSKEDKKAISIPEPDLALSVLNEEENNDLESDDSNETRDLDYYISKLKSLKTTSLKNGRKSPHKAMLLLAIFGAISDGTLINPNIYLNPNLISRFQVISNKYLPKDVFPDLNPCEPYIHLISEPFYRHRLFKPICGFNKSWTIQRVRSYVRYAEIDQELFDLVKKHYAELRDLLIREYLTFSAEETQIKDDRNKIKETIEYSKNKITIGSPILRPVIENKVVVSNEEGEKSSPNKFNTSKYNSLDFERYLKKARTESGKKYSETSIVINVNLLSDSYIKGKAKKYVSSGNIYDIESYQKINQLFADVSKDFNSGSISYMYLKALRLYIQFVGKVRNRQYKLVFDKTKDKASHGINFSPLKSETHKRISLYSKIVKITTNEFVICETSPVATIIEFVNKVGPEKVYKMKIRCGITFLVEERPNLKYLNYYKLLNDGYYLNTCSNTPQKVEQMQEIADTVGIDISFEIV